VVTIVYVQIFEMVVPLLLPLFPAASKSVEEPGLLFPEDWAVLRGFGPLFVDGSSLLSEFFFGGGDFERTLSELPLTGFAIDGRSLERLEDEAFFGGIMLGVYDAFSTNGYLK